MWEDFRWVTGLFLMEHGSGGCGGGCGEVVEGRGGAGGVCVGGTKP